MNIVELKELTDKALHQPPSQDGVPVKPWDSLDQLEIITHLNEVLGDRVNQAEGLNNFEDLESLAAILREEGLLE